MSATADDPGGGYSSPPCWLHEIDPAYSGLNPTADAQQRTDVMRWRKAERERQIVQRLAVDAAERTRLSSLVAHHLDAAVGPLAGRTISLYWPFRGEPDLRPWMRDACGRGAVCALPLVLRKAAPLVFLAWRPGARLARGVWDIPFPADGAEIVPDIVVAPLVAFDPLCYRLGYGGGFFDRTLAAMNHRPRIVGVGYAAAGIATIYPQPHDIPMDVVVTENGAHFPAPPTR